MIVKQSQYAKHPYLYSRGIYKEILNVNLINTNKTLIGSHRNKNKYYIKEIHCSFDIETTHITDTDYTTMYIWSFAMMINNIRYVFYGHTWSEFLAFLEHISNNLGDNEKIIVWVANLSYEWQFMKKHLNVTNSFFRNKRQPFYIEHNGNIIFQEALNFFGGSLKSLAKNKCNTQKAVGDLDYNKQRFYFNCNLTEKEEGYTDNDVLILIEWGQIYYNEYIKKSHFKPVSVQSIIRQDMKKGMFNQYSASQIQNIRKDFPDKDIYDKIMIWLYRGGYVHANVRYVGDLLKNIPSRDLTSAYPYYMLTGYVPSGFERIPISNFNEIRKDKTKCWFAKITFYNIKNRYNHSIESISKCLEKEKVVNDNGRVMRADMITVYLNELDFEIYEKFYKWEGEPVIHELYVSNKVKLPQYVINVLFDAYSKKAILKAQNKPYADEKTVVNSCYGVMVTKFNEYDLEYQSDTDTFIEKKANFEKVKKRAILLPQWGVWITSGIRNLLLNTAYEVIKIGGDPIYFDTDSIKPNDIKYDYIFDEINITIDKKVKHYCDYYKLDYTNIKGLGEYELEGVYKAFKTLGCKRYIYVTEKGAFKQTIAGLPKDTLLNYSKEQHLKNKRVDLFKHFDNQMSYDYTTKLTSLYIDEGFTIEIDGHKITELSCITLDNAPFTLTLKDTFIELINEMYNSRQEKRILG